MTALRIGSLFSGYGGLEQGVQAVLGGTVAWHSEVDPGASRILAHRYPGVPNLGDITAIDWSAVEPVDVLTGGFPCQDVSAAGKRAGIRPGTRSGLWSQFAYVIDQLRPSLVLIENVRGLLSAEAHHPAHGDLVPCPWCVGDPDAVALRALGAVLGDLADLGFDAEWVGLRAADVGAPHGRHREFVLAWPAADAERGGRGGGTGALGAGRRAEPADGGAAAAADAEGDRRHEGRAEPARQLGGPSAAVGGHAAADTGCDGRQGHAERDQRTPGRLAAPHRHDTDRRRVADAHAPGGHGPLVAAGDDRHPAVDGTELGAGHRAVPGGPAEGVRQLGRGAGLAWGPYAAAVRRWERALGRPAPAPTEPGGHGMARVRKFAHQHSIDGYTALAMLRSGRWGARLAPRFVEWLMGLPAGWVTAVPGLSRADQLKALGNGVVPQQAAHAVALLLDRTGWDRRWAA